MYSDINAEWRLLSVFLQNNEAIYNTTAEVFTDERKDIFARMFEAYAKYGIISLDALKLSGDIPAQLTIDYKGDPRVLTEQLVRYARRRQLFDSGQRLLEQAKQDQPDETVVRNALDFPAITPSADIYLQTGYLRLQAEMQQKRQEHYRFASTGLLAVDNKIGHEFPRKSVIILKAKEGTGKTAWVTSSMLSLGKQGIASHFWSWEMPKSLLLVRWCANVTGIDNTRIQVARDLTSEEMSRVDDAAETIQRLPMTVNENRVTIDELITETHYLANKGVRVFFIDYLQIASVFRYGNKNQDLGYFVQVCKDLAKRFDVTFVILSQVNDQKETRDTGEAEKISDVNFYMEKDSSDSGSDWRTVYIHIHKNRFGDGEGTLSVLFNGSLQKFVDLGTVDGQETFEWGSSINSHNI